MKWRFFAGVKHKLNSSFEREVLGLRSGSVTLIFNGNQRSVAQLFD